MWSYVKYRWRLCKVVRTGLYISFHNPFHPFSVIQSGQWERPHNMLGEVWFASTWRRSPFFGKEVRAQTAVFRPYSRPIKATIFTAQLSYQVRHQGLLTLFQVKNTNKQPELDSFETYILLLSIRLLASCAKHHLAILFCSMHSCRLSPNKWKNFGINRNIGIHWQSKQIRFPLFLQVQEQVGKAFYGTVIWEKWKVIFSWDRSKAKEVPRFNSRFVETQEASAGNFCHSNSRIKHQQSVDFLVCVCVCNSIALWQICGEKTDIDTCWHVDRKTPLALVVETQCNSTSAPQALNMAFPSF